MKRRRVRGPREFTNLGSFDMDVGWAYDLERNDETQTISVIVAGGISGRSGMAEESPARSARRAGAPSTAYSTVTSPPGTSS
jgi:hypothetical protein